MSESNWEADKMLDVYIYDYFVKRGLKVSAQAFKTEGKVSPDPVAIDAPGGFLLEWWSVFWDIFIARTNGKRSDVAASYLQSQMLKAREQQQQQQLLLRQPQHPQLQQQMQMQQLLLQRQAQQQQQQQQNLQAQPQQQRENLLSGTANGIGGNDSHGKQSPGTANAAPANMCEEKLKLPGQKDSLDDAATKQKLGNNSSFPLDNHASILKSAAAPGQSSGRVSPGPAGGMSPHVQPRSQQFPGSTPDIKTEMNPILNARAAGFEGSLIGTPGSNQGGNNLTLKGWPLTGLDQLRPGLLQQPKSLMQGSQPFNQSQILTPQYQQQLMMAQHNLTSPSVDLESRRMRMLLNNQNLLVGKDGLSNPPDNVAPNLVSSLQAGDSMLSHMDPEMLTKFKLAQMQQQQQSGNLSQQHVPSGQQSQSSNHILQQEKITATGNTTGGGSMSNSFNGNDQGSTNQTGRKRKQAASSPGPANNSTGTVNTAGLSPSSAPSTPSIHTAGDAMSMHALPHSGSYSKPLMTFGADNSGILKAPSNQLWDDKGSVPADIDRLVDDVEDNVESFLSSDDADIRGDVGRGMDVSKGFTFTEVGSICASSGKIGCCHFSSDGKLLASGGHDKKVVLWYTDSLKPKSTLEEHSLLITDVRFSPSMARLATSSFDKHVRVWDADNQPSFSIRNFTGHSAPVMSVDFHPNKDDIICSCDDNGEIRYWSINHGTYTRVFKGGSKQVRFQPRLGRYLAAASENVILILDAETQACLHSLQGHSKPIHSICWDPAGELLASVSDDTVKVWTMRPGSEGNCLHKLSCNGNKFYSCVFHPKYSSLLIVGCYESLELWNVADNARMTISVAHENLITSLAASVEEGLVASASHDKIVKLWK